MHHTLLHKSDELRVYLQAMRQYMPPGHVRFLSQLESLPALIRTFVADSHDPVCVRPTTRVALVEDFRSTHLEYAARYIQKQAPVGMNSTEYGTGGTPFMRYLKNTATRRTPTASRVNAHVSYPGSYAWNP